MQETDHRLARRQAGRQKRPGDIARPTDDVFPKRVLIFSPHPDDDVISMGGTLIRLVDQGHEVHVAYQTSGNIAVFDADAIRFADFAAEYTRMFAGVEDRAGDHRWKQHIETFLRNKRPGQVDSPEVQQIKGLIRRGEARAAGRDCGVPVDQLHFMDLPFYETGAVRKKPLGPEDVRLTVELLQKIKPHQVYAAGDLSDPHGTHRVCLSAVFQPSTSSRIRTGPSTARSGSTAARGRSGSRRRSRWPSRSARVNWAESGRRSSSTRARRTRPCSPVPTSASSGSGPRTATADGQGVRPVGAGRVRGHRGLRPLAAGVAEVRRWSGTNEQLDRAQRTANRPGLARFTCSAGFRRVPVRQRLRLGPI